MTTTELIEKKLGERETYTYVYAEKTCPCGNRMTVELMKARNSRGVAAIEGCALVNRHRRSDFGKYFACSSCFRRFRLDAQKWGEPTDKQHARARVF